MVDEAKAGGATPATEPKRHSVGTALTRLVASCRGGRRALTVVARRRRGHRGPGRTRSVVTGDTHEVGDVLDVLETRLRSRLLL
jgi:hypothetical protein